ncbi:MAG: hypothetical protein ACLQQ4_09435 [Bacteroidia bacterium]
MKNTGSKQVESLKKSINSVSRNSKESIKSLVESNAKQIDFAVESNKKTFESISKTLTDNKMDTSVVSSIKSTLVKSIKLSEDSIDTIIDAHTGHIDLSIDFTNKFMEFIKDEEFGTKQAKEKLIYLVKEHFDKSTDLSLSNMEKIVSMYNNHLNLALNFNQKFADSINDQIISLYKLQKNNIDSFLSVDMISEWWKNIGEEKAKAIKF